MDKNSDLDPAKGFINGLVMGLCGIVLGIAIYQVVFA